MQYTLLNCNDLVGEFTAIDRQDIPSMESCTPATASDLRNMQRKRDYQRQYCELMLQSTKNYEERRKMTNNPDYYRLITSSTLVPAETTY